MKVILIRHLPTPGNEKRQYIGRTDEGLSKRAVEEFLARNVKAMEVQHIVASPMKRCIQTAELIWPGQKIRTEPLLKECDFGLFEGKTYEELKSEPDYIRWLESGGKTAFPQGESQETFRARCAEGVKRQIRCYMEKGACSLAFVVHGGTIMAALEALAEGKHTFYDWQTGNGCGYMAEADEKEWITGTEILRNVEKVV